MVTAEAFFLRQLCRLHLDAHDAEILRNLWNTDIDSEQLVAQAEGHGLAPLLQQHLRLLDLPVSQTTRQQLLALKVRHQRSNKARIHALVEILSSFARHDIESVVLKGAALIHVLYDTPALRPMSDIDILVHPGDARQAQNLLHQHGYRMHENHNPYQQDHHHLPMAQKPIDGVSIHIEIHTDAQSRDANGTINMDTLTTEPRQFSVGSESTASLGHIDMLRHLCHHMLEPIDRIKLGAVADLYGYATEYAAEIDWKKLDTEFPFVRNTFQMLHYLSPLPQSLHGWLTPPNAPSPQGTGEGYPPLSSAFAQHRNRFHLILKLLSAPDWWLHCFYNIPPGKSLLIVKTVRHPFQVGRWLFRRWRLRGTSLSAAA